MFKSSGNGFDYYISFQLNNTGYSTYLFCLKQYIMFWDEDDPVIGIKTPMNYKHMKLLRYILRIVSGWPGKQLGEKTWKYEEIYGYYNTTLSLTYLAMGITYLKLHIAELTFFELGHLFIVLMMNILSSSRASTLSISKKYKAVAKQYIGDLHLFFHRAKSEYAKKMHIRVHRISHYFTIFYSLAMLMALILFNMTPVYNNYKAGKYESRNLVNTTYEHAIYLTFPFNTDTNLNGYLIAYVIIWYGSFLCATSVCSFDMFLSIMVFTLYGHFKILIHLLESFPIPASIETNKEFKSNNVAGSEFYSISEQKIVKAKLKECIRYHLVIVDFINKMSDAFGLALLIYYVFHQISGCLLLLECSQMTAEALARYLPLTIIMFQQLIQTSIIFESIGAMCEKLKDAVYCLPWEYMDTGNRRTVGIYFINVQEPIHISAKGMVNVGVTTMASILKTSFSYFTFLRTVSE